ncbi:MAG: dephospho-CoA kinase [Nitrospirae bacterium]|nr:dephospho-CoA kinase [Nitrospirota bacterium]
MKGITMFFVGLTGGIASGKSLVARVFKDLGAHVIDADRIVHELLEPEQQACREVLDHFGKEILLPNGGIDRRKLGELVFNDPEKRAWLNSFLHPKVFNTYTVQVRHLQSRQPDILVILDAALLIETGYHRNMDRIVVVYADREQQIKRLSLRDKFTREQALARITSQMPLAEKRAHADYVIDNTGNREAAEAQAREVFLKLKQDAETTA